MAETSSTLGDSPTLTEPGRRPAREGVEYVRGDEVGRYVILDVIGAGGMGIVFAAFDPELDRKLALKVLHEGPPGGSRGSEGQRRLVREARAMAKLSHPNVITIHDVGVHDERVFLAMEFVDGQTLSRWQKGDHVRAEILDVFEAAGRGLAAAHAAGLVHRDFKPDNVMVGHDGRVRVMDFGLARAEGSAAAPAELVDLERVTGDDLAASITRTGGLVGTPAYMAPEQFKGKVADAKSDQFAFCVALFAALFGARPFEGDSMANLAMRVIAGELRIPSGSNVPPRLRKAVVRGLAVDPSARWPDMESLLAALARARTSRLRKATPWLVVGGAAAAVAAASLGRGEETPTMCRGGAEEIASVYDDDTRTAIESALTATDLPYATTTVARVRRRLDDYADGWAAMHREACEATQVRGDQSADLMDRRMACLDRRRAELEAVTTILAGVDADTLARTDEILGTLTPIDSCADTDALMSTTPLPEDPALREEVTKIRKALAGPRALLAAGRYDDARHELDALVPRAQATGDPAIRAETLRHLARAQNNLGQDAAAAKTYEDALWTAHAAGADRVEAETSLDLIGVCAADLSDFEAAHRWVRHAEADVQRVGGSAHFKTRLLHNVARLARAEARYADARAAIEETIELCDRELTPMECSVYRVMAARIEESDGNFERALEIFEEVLALEREEYGDVHPHVAGTLCDIGDVYRMLGRWDDAHEVLAEAERVQLASLGPDHPDLAIAWNARAIVYLFQDDFAQAESYFRRSYDLLRTRGGEDHPQLPALAANLAMAIYAQGRYDEALQLHEQALARDIEVYGREHPSVANKLANIGDVLYRKGDLEGARQRYAEAYAIRAKVHGEDHPDTARARLNLAQIAMAEDETAEALRHYERAVAVYRSTFGDDHPMTATALAAQATALSADGQHAAAVEALEHALKIHERANTSASTLAEVQSALGRALMTAGGDPDRARRLVAEARDAFAAVGGVFAGNVADLDAWLAKNGG